MQQQNDTTFFNLISIPGTWRKFIVILQGIADCGFDMRRAKAEIFEAARKITVTLPRAQVLRVRPDMENGLRIYSQEGGWFSKTLTLEEQNTVISGALEDVRRKAAEDWNILSRAEDSAAEFYRNFLGSLGYDVAVFFTDDPEKLNIPSGVKTDTMKGGGVVVFHAA